MQIRIDIPEYNVDKMVERFMPRFGALSEDSKQRARQILRDEVGMVVYDCLALPHDNFNRVVIDDPDILKENRVKVHCPFCGQRVFLRRAWQNCEVGAYAGLTGDGKKVIPVDEEDVLISDWSNESAEHDLYCAECGETVFRSDKELFEYLTREKED